MKTVFDEISCGRGKEQPQNKETFIEHMKAPFFGDSFSNRDRERIPIQCRRKGQYRILKEFFSSRADPSILIIIAPELLN